VPSVISQGQSDCVYFDINNAFVIVPIIYFLIKLLTTDFSLVILTGFMAITQKKISLCISSTLSFSYIVKSGVPQDPFQDTCFLIFPLMMAVIMFLILPSFCE
jgi:membrane protein insertase Oxa1/YidC/SpoIIIJ